jgi:hypothetical protein
MASAVERRCKAVNRQGVACRATVVNAAGYCVAHDPERPADMRALGKASAKARRRPKAERVHESLRTYLKREVPPERVWHALEAAMLGNNESARVSASRVLLDALHEPEAGCPRCANREVEVADAAAEFERLVMNMAERHRLAVGVYIDHECDQLRDVAAEHGSEELLVAVQSHRERLFERFEARRREEMSEREREEILTSRDKTFRGGDERVQTA